MDALSALHGLAGAATGVALLALVITVLAALILWRLRKDRLTLRAAERLEAVDITSVVKRHVPSHLQSQKSGDELPIARESIARKSPRWMKVVALSGIVTLGAGAASSILIDRNMKLIAAARLSAQAPAPVNALRAISGVWGWKYEFLQSCSQNPHTISVGEGNKELSIQFAKPVWDGTQEVTNRVYTIIEVEPNKLVLGPTQSPQGDGLHQPDRWFFVFSDEDTYRIARSGVTWTTGDIVRCHN